MAVQKNPVKMYTQVLPFVILILSFVIGGILFEPDINFLTIWFAIAVSIVLCYLYYRVHKFLLGLVYIVGTGTLSKIVLYGILFEDSLSNEFYYYGEVILDSLIVIGSFYLLYRWTKSWNSQC